MYRILALADASHFCAHPLLACGAKRRRRQPRNYDLSAASNPKFLADYAAKPGVFKTEDGLEYRVIKAGTGKAPQSGRRHGDGQLQGLADQRQSVRPDQAGQTADFPAGQLIPGWVEALSLMKEGDTWELVIPSDLGYGADGAGERHSAEPDPGVRHDPGEGHSRRANRQPDSELVGRRHARHARRPAGCIAARPRCRACRRCRWARNSARRYIPAGRPGCWRHCS